MAKKRLDSRSSAAPKEKAKHQFVIVDREQGGYATHDPLEGWIFTRLLSHAFRFPSQAEAERIATDHYITLGSQVHIRTYEEESA